MATSSVVAVAVVFVVVAGTDWPLQRACGRPLISGSFGWRTGRAWEYEAHTQGHNPLDPEVGILPGP